METIKEMKLGILLNASIDYEFLDAKSSANKEAYLKYINDFFKTEVVEDIKLGQVSSVTLSDAKLYQEDLLKQGFQTSSVNQQITALSYFYDFLIENNVTDINPFSKAQGLSNVKKYRYYKAKSRAIKFIPKEIETQNGYFSGPKQLNNYSRNIDRTSNRQCLLDYLLKLPISIWPEPSIRKIQELKELVSKEKELRIGFWNLLRYFPDWKVKSKRKFVLFLDLLDNLNIGLEPDFRFTGIIPKINTDIILFSLDSHEPTAIHSSAYALAFLNLKLGTLVSKADGIVVEEEIILLKNQIKLWPGLNNSEKKRLELCLDWLLSRPTDSRGIYKGVRSLSSDEKAMIGDWLIKVSQADGIIRPEEIKLIEKLYSTMNLDIKELHQKMNVNMVKPMTKKSSINSEKDNPTAAELLDFLLDYIDL